MSFAFLAIELSTYAFALWCGYDAWKRGHRWLMILLAASLFGLGAELYFLVTEHDNTQGSHYTYSRFLLMLGWDQFKVPLWVAVGWGCIVYASIWTAESLGLRGPGRPLVAGLLALNIDLSLDPLAEGLGFWTWHNVPDTSYFGVPFDNFLGWLMIVGTYTWSLSILFRKVLLSWRGKDYWVPFAALVPALALTALGQWVLNFTYRHVGGQALPFVVICGLACGVAVYYGARAPRNRAPSAVALSLPVYFHLLLYVLLLVTGAYRSRASLLIVIPVTLFVGFTAYAWPCLDRLFPSTEKTCGD